MTWRPREELLVDQKSCPFAGRQGRYGEWFGCGRVNIMSDENNSH
jgi:hypothetical protein